MLGVQAINLMMVSYHLAKFGGRRHSASGDILVFVYHVTLQDHVIKALNDLMVRSLSMYVTILRHMVVIGTVVVKI